MNRILTLLLEFNLSREARATKEAELRWKKELVAPKYTSGGASKRKRIKRKRWRS